MSTSLNHGGKAAVLSFIFCGLGQLYNGHIIKGLILIFATCLSLITTVVGGVLIYLYLKNSMPFQILWSGIGVLMIGLLSVCLIAIYSIIDAYKQARKE